MAETHAAHPQTETATSGGATCPRCFHDNTNVAHPSYSKVLAALRLPQRRPRCEWTEDYVSGMASAVDCGCKHNFHAAI